MEHFEQLRRITLAKQGLLSEVEPTDGLQASKLVIEHLGYVQIDTLSVVERAHNHVLWSRVPNYNPDYLNQLITEQSIFEYWYHAAAYLPMQDYRFALIQMNSIRNGESRYFQSTQTKMMKDVLAQVKFEGPLRLRDIDKKGGSKGSWWSYGPGKRAVEHLFMRGELMVCKRNGMEKVYDLPERCLPSGLNMSTPSLYEYAEYLFNTTKRAHGVFNWKQLVHLRPGKPLRETMRQLLNDHIQAGDITVVKHGKGKELYVDTQTFEQPIKCKNLVKILSPFDNLVIHRERLNELFGFDYKIECYVAQDKRKYGYFCLPILFGDQLVGRIDCKAHRSEQRFEVLSLHLEDLAFDRQEFFSLLIKELEKFAGFNGCPILDKKVVDKSYRKQLALSA